MQEKDFLKGYEIRNLDFGPRLYKIFAFAALINLVAIAGIGQTNMLARSACESPFVNRICSVLDTVYFSSKILTTDSGYVVKEYEETKIQDSDVVWVDQTNVSPALQYPAGYFQIANRDELAMLQQLPQELLSDPILPPPPPPITPPITPSRRNPLGDRPNLPKKSGSLIDGDLPEDTTAQTDEDNKKPDENDVATNKTPEQKPPQNKPESDEGAPPIEINNKPLYDFVDGVVEKVSRKEVDLQSKFRVVMVGYINDEGKLDKDPKRSYWIPEEEQGDAKMILVAKDAVEKAGDSGWLQYLNMHDIRNIRIEFFQDDDQLAVNVLSLMPSENKARSMASVFKSYVQIALFSHENNLKKLKDDEVLLLKALQISNDRNLLKIQFNLEKDVAHPIINTRLKEYQADKEKNKLESPSPIRPNSAVDTARAGKRAAR